MRRSENEVLADLILKDGNIITMDASGQRAEALAVREGRLIFVGSMKEAERFVGPATKSMSLRGLTILPGFIDAHTHTLGYGVNLSQVDCRSPPVECIDDILSRIAERAKTVRQGGWVEAWGYDHERLAERTHPTRFDLDRAAPENPVWLVHRSWHIATVNSQALKLARVDKKTPDPPEGKIERDPETGEPTGLLFEPSAKALVEAVRPKPSPQELAQKLRLAQELYVKAGVTSTVDANIMGSEGPAESELRAYLEALRGDSLLVRTNIFVTPKVWRENSKLVDEMRRLPGREGEKIRILGIKLILDGWIQGKTAALSRPYLGEESEAGKPFYDQHELNRLVAEADKAGFQVAIHAVGDRAVEMAARAFEALGDAVSREGRRHRIEHGSLVTPQLADHVAKTSTLIVTQPSFTYLYGDAFNLTLDEGRIRWLHPLRTLRDKGVKVCGSSDCPVSPVNPLLGIYSSVCRATESGKVVAEEEKVTVDEAIRMFTVYAAYATFSEDTKGSLEAGKFADMVALSADPYSVDPKAIKDIQVIFTMVDGKIVYQASESPVAQAGRA